MRNLILALAAVSSLAACAPKHSGVDIEHTYAANSLSCNPGGPTSVPDNIKFSNGKVTEGNCTADYSISGNELTISNLVGACTALPNFTSQPNAFSLSTNSDTGVVSLAFQPDTYTTGGCAIAMRQLN